MTLVFNHDRLPWAVNGYLLLDWWTFETLATGRWGVEPDAPTPRTGLVWQ